LLRRGLARARGRAAHGTAGAGRPLLPRPRREPGPHPGADAQRGAERVRARGGAAGVNPERLLNVLVVDGSAVVRPTLTAILSRDSRILPTAASDPVIALEKMRKTRPDVIVLDLELPRIDGLTFLRRIMAEDPIPVVVCSSLAERGAEAALRATEE